MNNHQKKRSSPRKKAEAAEGAATFDRAKRRQALTSISETAKLDCLSLDEDNHDVSERDEEQSLEIHTACSAASSTLPDNNNNNYNPADFVRSRSTSSTASLPSLDGLLSVKTATTADSNSRNGDDLSQAHSQTSSQRSSPRRRKHHKPPKELAKKSILILGATGRMGAECVRHFSQTQNPPTIYGFCRNFKGMSNEEMEHCRRHCEELIVGDATKAVDLHRALQRSAADTIIVCIGTGSSPRRTTVRASCATALVKVLVHPPFHHVKVVCISSAGAGDCPMLNAGFGSVGCVTPTNSLASAACILPSVGKNRIYDLRDHTKQEEIFMGNRTIYKRTVSPNGSGDKQNRLNQ